MAGLPPVPVPKRDRDEGLRWPFLLIGVVVGASIVTGGVLAWKGWSWGSPRTLAVSIPSARPRFHPDVPVRIESTSRIPYGDGPHPNDMLLCRVTVTNNSGKDLAVSVEDIKVVATDRQVHGGLPFVPTPQFGVKPIYGREVSPLGAVLLPKGKTSGDVTVVVEPGATITEIGFSSPLQP